MNLEDGIVEGLIHTLILSVSPQEQKVGSASLQRFQSVINSTHRHAVADNFAAINTQNKRWRCTGRLFAAGIAPASTRTGTRAKSLVTAVSVASTLRPMRVTVASRTNS